MYVCIVMTYSRVQINRKVANPVHGQLNKETFPCLRSRLKNCFARKVWLARPMLACSFSILTLIWCLLEGFLQMFAAVSIYIYHHTPSGQSRLYRVTQLRTDGVYCRESVVSKHNHCFTAVVHTVDPFFPPDLCLCVCVFFPSILDIKFVGRTSRGHTGGRSHRIFNPPSFCGACLDFCREKDSAIPFPRRP